MPQLNPEFFPPQLVWLFIAFGVLYLLMARVALPRISSVLSNRSQRIDSDLSEADQLKQDAQAAHENYEKALGEAKAKAHRIAQETRDRLAEETNRLKAEMDARLAEQTESAERGIAAAKAEALGNVREVASEAAVAVVERLLGSKPDNARVTAAVDAVMKARASRETA